VVFQSLRDQRDRDGPALAEKMQAAIFDTLDRGFFYQEIESVDQNHCRCTDEYDDGAALAEHEFRSDRFSDGVRSGDVEWRLLAYRYRKIERLYNTPNPLREIFSERDFGAMVNLANDVNDYTRNFLKIARQMLRQASAVPGAVITVVSNSTLCATLAKACLYDLARFIPPENVYNSRDIGKVECIRSIQERFGVRDNVVVIGDGPEEKEAARQLRLQFFQIDPHERGLRCWEPVEDIIQDHQRRHGGGGRR